MCTIAVWGHSTHLNMMHGVIDAANDLFQHVAKSGTRTGHSRAAARMNLTGICAGAYQHGRLFQACQQDPTVRRMPRVTHTMTGRLSNSNAEVVSLRVLTCLAQPRCKLSED